MFLVEQAVRRLGFQKCGLNEQLYNKTTRQWNDGLFSNPAYRDTSTVGASMNNIIFSYFDIPVCYKLPPGISRRTENGERATITKTTQECGLFSDLRSRYGGSSVSIRSTLLIE